MNYGPIAIVDYGLGNLRSVQNAVAHLGGNPVIVSNPLDLVNYAKIILPGVGAFGDAISHLKLSGMADALEKQRIAGSHILGICLGMQLMCSVSEEDGIHHGLGWFDARVIQFLPDTELSVPHMGWNSVEFMREDPLLVDLASGSDGYFVHSYYVQCDDPLDVLAETHYGQRFCSIMQRENVWGIQFHPEKSQGFGLSLIRNFLETQC